jgi:hypothetical protein
MLTVLVPVRVFVVSTIYKPQTGHGYPRSAQVPSERSVEQLSKGCHLDLKSVALVVSQYNRRPVVPLSKAIRLP